MFDSIRYDMIGCCYLFGDWKCLNFQCEKNSCSKSKHPILGSMHILCVRVYVSTVVKSIGLAAELLKDCSLLFSRCHSSNTVHMYMFRFYFDFLVFFCAHQNVNPFLLLLFDSLHPEYCLIKSSCSCHWKHKMLFWLVGNHMHARFIFLYFSIYNPQTWLRNR